MSLQEMQCFEGALFHKGCYKLMEDAISINTFIDSLVDYFVDPSNNWDLINKIFGIYGFSPTISQGSPSKDIEAGDGSKTPWSGPFGVVGCMVNTFDQFEKLGLLIDPELLRITYNIQPDDAERKRLQIWKSFFDKYKVVKETEQSMIVLSYTIASQHNSNSRVIYSPAQINMYANDSIKTPIKETGPYGSEGYSVLAKVPWDTSNTILSQVSSMLASPWESSLVNIELVEPIYEQRIYRFTVIASSLEEGGAAINFSGSELLFCTEKILRVPQLLIEDPNYVPEGEPPGWDEGVDGPWVPPGPDDVLVPVADCFSEYGERPEETLTYDILDGTTFHCGVMEGLVEIPDPEGAEGDTIWVTKLVDACPYKDACQNPLKLNPILVDFNNGRLALDLTSQPSETNMQAYTNDHVKIYYRIVHI